MRIRLFQVIVVLIILIGGGVCYMRYTQQAQFEKQSVNKGHTLAQSEKRMVVPPKRYLQQASRDQRGSVKKVTYQTTQQHVQYSKQALVYLPADYRQDRQKPYDVLYLMHGWNMSASDFLGETGTNQMTRWKLMIDHAIAEKRIKPLIVVAPTYYQDRTRITSDWDDDLPLNRRFATQELTNDLMPVIASQFYTYATGTQPSQLQQARNHQAFAGFSMGSATTWFVFQYDLKFFRYFMPMSGPNASDAAVMAKSVKSAGLNQDDFFIAASVGGADSTKYAMKPAIKSLWRQSVFTKDNLWYREDQHGGHDEQSFTNQSYNALPLLFKQ
ncbi:hypothetical protein EFP14_05385 [Lactiplantibacillus pentosus]|nr:hypothetical protein [Lactiplantibacillus pentosus]